MRLIFYIFVFSQFFNLLYVFAEKNKEESSEQEIKWERVKDERSNNLKEVIWKSYNNDEKYFENANINNTNKESDQILSGNKNEKNKFIDHQRNKQ